MIFLYDLPWPPSDNKKYAYRNFSKTKEWREFEAEIEIYRLHSLNILSNAKMAIKELNRPAIEFLLHSNRWLTKDGNIRKSDVSNRIKAAQDAAARLLEIDDCNFWHSGATKVTSPSDDYMDIRVYEYGAS